MYLVTLEIMCVVGLVGTVREWGVPGLMGPYHESGGGERSTPKNWCRTSSLQKLKACADNVAANSDKL